MRVEGQRATERATIAEQGLEVVKARQAETEAGLWTSLADTKAALQESLVALESKQSALELARKALESERKAWSEADQEVLTLRGQVMGMEEANARLAGQKGEVARQNLEMVKATFSRNAEELAKSREERHALEGELD
ncbi:uncharacterized protein [Miscanthus floridulus]|uniref:uncharacterized protein n=1 Tax=Miscanthus floridulus TaxID=154761 RepID=UPI00345A431F